MTDAELNEEIARLRGWRRMRDVSREELADLDYDRAYPETIATHWLDDGCAMQAHPPDYAGEWALAGPLLEDLADAQYAGAGVAKVFAGDDDAPERMVWAAGEGAAGVDEFGLVGVKTADTPTRAIALAWLAWKREEARR